MAPVPGRATSHPARRDAVLLPWQVVRVLGPSMVPTVRPGDRVLVHRRADPVPGDVVLARFDDLPGRHVVKRLMQWDTDGRAVLASDNAAAGGDSRTHGPGWVLGRVTLVVHRGRPRRVPPAPAL